MFGQDINVAGDACSVISLSESLQSDRCLSDFAGDDRWSLCSFASRTSCNSRYTSVETLLEQTNRKPIAKSGSKLLNVARYFTGSRLRRKFTQKKKQKSILLRKFSVIEEYKQKGAGSSLIHNADEVVSDSKSAEIAKSQQLERIPTVDERIPCIVVDAAESRKTKYFNVTGESASIGDVSKIPQKTVGSCGDLPSATSESILEEFVKRLDECIVSDEPPVEAKKKCIHKQERFSMDSDTVPDSEVDMSISSSSKIVSSPNMGIRSRTPPLSEMIPFSMSPPHSNVSSVKSITAPKVMGLGVRIFLLNFIYIF